MKKNIYKILIILLLMIDPSHFTTSSEIIKDSITYEEYLVIARDVKILTIKGKIEKHYKAFYANLDSINSPNFTKQFVQNLSCNALEAESLPSISIAQAALETGYGRHLKLKNNLFGIKGRGIKSRTKEFVNGRFITIYSEFQYFKTQKHAFDRHFEIISRYGVKGDNYVDWINTIVLNGYATDPNYSKKLKYIINKFQLDRLDKIQKLDLELNKLIISS